MTFLLVFLFLAVAGCIMEIIRLFESKPKAPCKGHAWEYSDDGHLCCANCGRTFKDTLE